MCVILTLQSCTQIKVPFQVPLWYNSPCNHRGESTTKVPYLFPMMGKQLQKKNRPLFRGRLLKPLIYLRLSLLAEVALQQAFESLAVAGLIAGHQHVLKSGSSPLRVEALRFLRRAAGYYFKLQGQHVLIMTRTTTLVNAFPMTFMTNRSVGLCRKWIRLVYIS